jgi:hypothetical protein
MRLVASEFCTCPETAGPNSSPQSLEFFVGGYVGLSLPVIGLGLALQEFSPKVTLLAFGLIIAVAMLSAAPALLDGSRKTSSNAKPGQVSRQARQPY